jgi:serine/threonine-protein kinase
VQLVPDPEAIGGERVKVNDWGLASLPAQGETPATAPEVPLEVPTYLAPELCRTGAPAADSEGSAGSASVDVYALGVLMYQMATGQPPFAGRPASEIIAMHIAALPPKLDAKLVAMPAGLPALVASMLIKDPKARPTMHEVEERLLQLAAQQQLAATLTPATVAARDELARALPSISDTLQVRQSPELGETTPQRGRIWALGILVSLLFLFGLWWLFMPLFGGPPSEKIVAAQQAPLPEDSPLPTARVIPVAQTSADPAGRVAAVGSGRQNPARHAALASYPPLRDARAVARPRSRQSGPMPPLRGASAQPAPRSPLAPPDADTSETPVVLLAAQTAFASGDYERAIDGASALLTTQPIAASLLLGKSACAVGDLESARRSYQSLRKNPAPLAALVDFCREHGIDVSE